MKEHQTLFWGLAEPLLAEESIVKSTMMGFPCLRVNGDFFASVDRKTGDLIVKLPANQVLDLIETEVGSLLRQTAVASKSGYLFPTETSVLWQQLINDARAFVEGNA